MQTPILKQTGIYSSVANSELFYCSAYLIRATIHFNIKKELYALPKLSKSSKLTPENAGALVVTLTS